MSDAINPEICFADQSIFENLQLDSNNVFDLLGDSLKQKLRSLLDQLHVGNSPVIHGEVHATSVIEGPVYIAKGATIGPFTYIVGPCFIDEKAEVRHGAFIRGNVYVGKQAVVGHTTEVKGSIFGNNAKAGHFAYVGDSVLGDSTNLGAGTKLANLKMSGSEVKVAHPETKQRIATGLRKLGAILGKESQTGCNAVLSPGTLLLPGTAVMPCTHYLGTLEKGVAGK